MRLSDFIRGNIEPILQDWERFARSLGSTTAGMDDAALRDHAEWILKAIVADIESPQSADQQRAKSEGRAPERAAHLPESAATTHGSVRSAEGFSLVEMVSEYRALRASVLRLWGRVRPPPGPEAYEELIRFNEAIDEALADSIQSFSHAIDQRAASRALHRMAALGTLSAGLGHDMANVLVTMRGCLKILNDKGFTPETAPIADGVNRAVEHIGVLSNGLRALAMDPEGSGGEEHTDLRAWWGKAISPFTWALPKGVRLHAESLAGGDDRGGDAPLPPVRIPEHALMQAVFNLVQNAGQALRKQAAAAKTDQGGVQAGAGPGGEPGSDSGEGPVGNIWITARLVEGAARASAREQPVVHLTVRDDWPGMTADQVARCTRPFFTTKARDQSMGLGLHLVRSAVERCGGELLVWSTPRDGTTFTLVLPVAEVPAQV